MCGIMNGTSRDRQIYSLNYMYKRMLPTQLLNVDTSHLHNLKREDFFDGFFFFIFFISGIV